MKADHALEQSVVKAQIAEKHPSGAKARVDFAAFTAPFSFAQGRLY
jgi:hypothetical protein